MRVTVIPVDKTIVLDGIGAVVEMDYPKDIHAIQWTDNSGHIEYISPTEPNKSITSKEYNDLIVPYINAFRKHTDKLKADIEESRIKNAPNVIREYREGLLSASDFTMMPDYNISEESRANWFKYREALRDITKCEGFPWGGDITKAPWPTKPKV